MITQEKLLERAQSGRRESQSLEFKSSFNPNNSGEWCEIIKDVVAFANSGGGAIVFGLNDAATPSGFDVTPILAIDTADITNKIERYTAYQFSDFELQEFERDGVDLAAILVRGVSTPMVFQRPGTYEIEERRQKTAFSNGTVYFRHGSKSEPATMDDLQKWKDREIELVRASWLGGIRQVVEAPAGHEIQIVQRTEPTGAPIKARITNDENAVAVRPQNAEEIWPHRQIDVLRQVNRALPTGVHINGHDILCVRNQHDISPTSKPQFVFKPHASASPQYSALFIDWLTESYDANNEFFCLARQHYRENR